MAKDKSPGTTPPVQEKTASMQAQPPSRVMYLGPTMAENGQWFQTGRIFSNGLPQKWIERALLEPEFSQLLVAVDQVPKAMADLQNPNSSLSNAKRLVGVNYAKRCAAKKEKK